MNNFSFKPIYNLFFNLNPTKLNLNQLTDLVHDKENVQDFSVVLNTQSICFLKFEINKSQSLTIMNEVENCINGILNAAGKKLLMMQHYPSESSDGNQIIRTEIIYA